MINNSEPGVEQIYPDEKMSWFWLLAFLLACIPEKAPVWGAPSNDPTLILRLSGLLAHLQRCSATSGQEDLKFPPPPVCVAR